ncbi:hypothetical protein ASPZODRAFT_151296 [Penicilliopsis zonata CBS 506.65]|uniref:Glycosyl transferase CAP10 domain-containing protein n=1 Tax=Penicilliopsis zonata CBS 506.65 TaxID=1073090 RepID=A0A1L9SL64_9EURO|nr:hypothetical protein ASPZODRAFT_151296 [Penicilliopsis zonata CBS 506.65]OJJ47861.1 hypothetical protein ASPZODRAFT_151296 [Penicilliopsis zonata CBS 506.65]
MTRFFTDLRLQISVGAFLLSSLLLTLSYDTTFAFDHPIHSIVLSCFITGLSLVAFSCLLNRAPKPDGDSQQKYTLLSLSDRSETAISEPPPARFGTNRAKTRNVKRVKLAVLYLICCIRVGIYRELTIKVECAPKGYAYAIPLLVSLYECWYNSQSCQPVNHDDDQDGAEPSDSEHGAARLYERIGYFVLQGRLRFVIAAGLLSFSGFLASSFYNGSQSTFICPTFSSQAAHLRTLKVLATILDTVILIGAAELSRTATRSPDASRKQTMTRWGHGCLVVAMAWGVIGLILRNHSLYGQGFFVNDTSYYRSAVGQAVLLSILVVSASQLMPHFGLVGMVILAGFIGIFFPALLTIINNQQPFPFISPTSTALSFVAATLGLFLYLTAREVFEEEPESLLMVNKLIRCSLGLLLFVGLVFAIQHPSVAYLHSIDLLIYEGRLRHDLWLSQARGSTNLEEAVLEYRRRYNQHPPPGFDKWYDYATSRSSVVIDDFDQIYRDILPFRALSPARLRELTHQLVTNPLNSIGAISIRDGKPRVQEGIMPTHKWMVSGAAEMIEKFSEHLPDMDLAFNLDDEPRIAVPWETISKLRNDGIPRGDLPPDESLLNGWPAGRGEGWAPIEPANQTTDTVFIDDRFNGAYDRYVSAVCPPSSKARSQRFWDRHQLCLDCLHPHSMGQFPTEWHLALDTCHQPDLVTLHGFMLSPTTLKVSQELVPLFSQSSISGFSDIVYPSPWNYIDKIQYAPSEEYPELDYGAKQNSLFWIGTTTEGLSSQGQWKGMARQRFVHHVNNNSLNAVSVLLRSNNRSDTYSYQIMDGLAPVDQLGLTTSVHLVDLVRCHDCESEEKQFSLAPPVDFQQHWNHRYLFDMDGAGFSGRFLPFLQSNSLPFRTGVFRQWLDSRVTAWLHFVPIDLRFHGLWSTLAYFAGTNITKAGKPLVLMEPHDLQGKWIADQGREWAEATLRKEDMEIYFFRLLLEWARLTDDRRDILGFKLE